MAQVTGLGTTWNLPNYAGELFTADKNQTPLLSMIGGLTGGRQSDNFEFPTAVLYDFPEAKQPEITEAGAVTAPEAIQVARSQETNVVQIFQESIELTYAKQSNSGRLSGLNTAGQSNSIASEKAFQIQHKLTKIARDVEYTFFGGTFQKATRADEPNKTRGLVELTTSSSGTSIAAADAALNKTLLDQLYREMAENGAYFDNMILFCGAYQKQVLTQIYSSQFGSNLPATRNVGGVNITEIETDFFKLGVCWDRFVPADTILIVDVAHLAPVFQPVPEKGVLFTEPLAKSGASERLQIYGQIGLAHAPAFLHGSITGLKVGV